MRRLIPPILFFLSVVVMMLLWFVFPLATFLSYPFNLLGILLIILGIGVAKLGSDTFERAGTNIHTFKDPDVLITEGLYKISRNPMYLGFAVALIGVAITLGNVSSVAVVVAFIFITDRWYITFEEAAMQRRFGEQYANYKKHTRRWL